MIIVVARNDECNGAGDLNSAQQNNDTWDTNVIILIIIAAVVVAIVSVIREKLHYRYAVCVSTYLITYSCGVREHVCTVYARIKRTYLSYRYFEGGEVDERGVGTVL